MIRVYYIRGWYRSPLPSPVDITDAVCGASLAYYPQEKTSGTLNLAQETLYAHRISLAPWRDLIYAEFTPANGTPYTLWAGLVVSTAYDTNSGLWATKLDPLESLLDRQFLLTSVRVEDTPQAQIIGTLLSETLPLCHLVDAGSTVERTREYKAYDNNSVLALAMNLSEVIGGPDWFTYFSPRPVTLGGLTFPAGYSVVAADDLSDGAAVAVDSSFLVSATVTNSGGANAYQSTVVAASRNIDGAGLVGVASRRLWNGEPPSILIDAESNSVLQEALDERAEGLLATYDDGVKSVDLVYSFEVILDATAGLPLPLRYYNLFSVETPTAVQGYESITGIYGGCSYEFGSSGWLIKPRIQVVS